jgi:hypothetical protein
MPTRCEIVVGEQTGELDYTLGDRRRPNPKECDFSFHLRRTRHRRFPAVIGLVNLSDWLGCTIRDSGRLPGDSTVHEFDLKSPFASPTNSSQQTAPVMQFVTMHATMATSPT